MGLAPGSHPFDMSGVFEVIAVGGLAQPALLTGGFAGLAALGFGAVALALHTARVGLEQGLTVLTLMGWVGTCHGPESPQAHDREDREAKEENGAENREGRRLKKGDD